MSADGFASNPERAPPNGPPNGTGASRLARPPKRCPHQEEVLRCTRQDPTTKTLPRAIGRSGPTITRAATGVPPDAAEHPDSYPPWLVLGLLSPFLLALPLYPLLWRPVSAFPVADALWALLAAIFGLLCAGGNPPAGNGAARPGGPADPAFWDFGPLISPQVALTSAVAVLLAWFVLSGMVGKRRWWYPEGAAKRGFRAGLRLARLAVFLPADWWANRTPAAS